MRSNRVGTGGRQGARRIERDIDSDHTREFDGGDLASSLARQATYWVYSTIGRFRGRPPAIATWIPADRSGWALFRELADRFRLRDDLDSFDPHEMQDAIQEALQDWACRKYGGALGAHKHLAYLTQLCYRALCESGADDFTFEVLSLLDAIRKDHARPREVRALERAARLLKRSSPAGCAALEKVIAERSSKRRDGTVEVITRVFEMGDRRWRIFDKRGTKRARKLRIVEAACESLDKALRELPLAIRSWSSVDRPADLRLTAQDRYMLISMALKAVIVQAKTITPDSVRARLSYYRYKRRTRLPSRRVEAPRQK
jgi:hypothetical protein